MCKRLYYIDIKIDLLLNGNFNCITSEEMAAIQMNGGYAYGSPCNWTASTNWGCDILCANCFGVGNGESNRFHLMLEGAGFFFSQGLHLPQGEYNFSLQCSQANYGYSSLLGIFLNSTEILGPISITSGSWRNYSTVFQVTSTSNYVLRAMKVDSDGAILLDNFFLKSVLGNVVPLGEPTSLSSVSPSPTISTTTFRPFTIPSVVQTTLPVVVPSIAPTIQPSSLVPSLKPTSFPSPQPSVLPSPRRPSTVPSLILENSSPSLFPSNLLITSLPIYTLSPSTVPSSRPIAKPTITTSSLPSTSPSTSPTSLPSAKVTVVPTAMPRPPSNDPTRVPSVRSSPSNLPSAFSSVLPSVVIPDHLPSPSIHSSPEASRKVEVDSTSFTIKIQKKTTKEMSTLKTFNSVRKIEE